MWVVGAGCGLDTFGIDEAGESSPTLVSSTSVVVTESSPPNSAGSDAVTEQTIPTSTAGIATTGSTSTYPPSTSDPTFAGTEGTTNSPLTSDTTHEPAPTNPDPFCGDGILDNLEQCDDGADNGSGMACRADCQLNVCGDMDVGPGEECDSGVHEGDDHGCTNLCKFNVCGDGIVGPGEGCDDANRNDTDECNNQCMLASCGDGIVAQGESCDDANQINTDLCTNACTAATCSDGFIQPGIGEECDDGVDNADNAVCTQECRTATCGDGSLYNTDGGAEQCDLGADNNNSGMCTLACKLPVCGDGLTQPSNMEECDDANTIPLDGCGPSCMIENLCIADRMDLNQVFADDAYDGTKGTMVCIDLECAKAGTVQQVQIFTGISHTHIGDLTIKLISPANMFMALISRPGVLEAADNGTNLPAGDSSEINKSHPITFRDSGAKDAEKMGDTLASTTSVICKDDMQCDYFPNKGAAAGLTNLAGYTGTQSMGTWKFCIADSNTGNFGTVDRVRMTLILQ